jgi:hypothetical protein
MLITGITSARLSQNYMIRMSSGCKGGEKKKGCNLGWLPQYRNEHEGNSAHNGSIKHMAALDHVMQPYCQEMTSSAPISPVILKLQFTYPEDINYTF